MHMRINAPYVVALLVLAGAPCVVGGDLTGRVVLKGTPKPEITIDMASDPRCAALHTQKITTRHYVVGADNGLANVLVFVKAGLENKEYPIPSETPVLDQVGCEYSPYVMGVRKNQKFLIKNSDPTLHNVHATPKPGGGNAEFNFAQPVKNMTTEKTFTTAEAAIRFKCDVHPWMFAYVGVFDHPFFAVTDKDGNFKISGLPNGKYTVEAWHQRTHRAEAGQAKEVAVEGDTQLEFTIDAAP
jgi:hypothetical protein